MSDEPELTGEQRHWIERISRAYRAGPMPAARRAAFDAALEERLERRGRRPLWGPLGAVAAAALAALWLGIPGAPEISGPGVETEFRELLLATGDDGLSDEAEEPLPDEYLAIESFFLDGV